MANNAKLLLRQRGILFKQAQQQRDFSLLADKYHWEGAGRWKRQTDKQTDRERRRWRSEPPAGFSEFYSVVIDQPHMVQQP